MPRITEDEARALWHRAAELQAEAEAERERPRGGVLEPTAGQGLSLDQISEVAEGAGIDPDYVRLALAERRLAEGEGLRRDKWTARSLRFLIDEPDAIEVSRPIAAAPERVLETFRALAATPPFRMIPEDRLGDDPLVDGVLVYRLDGAATFHEAMRMGDARVLLVTVRPERGGARLRLRIPMFDRGLNLALTGGLAGLLGSGGGYGGAAAGAALAGALGSASLLVLAGPAVIGVVAGGAAGVAGFRRVYRWGRRKGESAALRIIQAVAVRAEGGAADLPSPAGG